MKKILKASLVLILALAFTLPVLPAGAEANYNLMNALLKQKLQAGEKIVPVMLAFDNDFVYDLPYGYVDSYLAPSDIADPLWLYEGTLEEWWAKENKRRTEKAKELFGWNFENAGIDYDSITYIPETGSYVLTYEQIFLLKDTPGYPVLSFYYIEPANETLEQKIEPFTVTAADALDVLRKVVGSSYYSVTYDYDRDGEYSANDALIVLQMAVGKRRAIRPRETHVVTYL